MPRSPAQKIIIDGNLWHLPNSQAICCPTYGGSATLLMWTYNSLRRKVSRRTGARGSPLLPAFGSFEGQWLTNLLLTPTLSR